MKCLQDHWYGYQSHAHQHARFQIQVVVDGPFERVLEKWPGFAHLSKLVSTEFESTTIFTFFASCPGGLIVIDFLLKTNSVTETRFSPFKRVASPASLHQR